MVIINLLLIFSKLPMKKIILLISLLLTLFSNVSAQKLQWNKHIKNEDENMVSLINAKEFINGSNDYYSAFYYGQKALINNYKFNGNQRLRYNQIISHCSDKTIVLATANLNTISIDSFKSTNSYNYNSFQLTKYTEEGRVLWIKEFGSLAGCSVFDMKTSPDGSIFLIMAVKDFEFEFGAKIIGANLILVRLNKDGMYLSHCILNKFNISLERIFNYYSTGAYFLYSRDLLIVDKKGTGFLNFYYFNSDTVSKKPLEINIYEGVKVLSFDTNYNFRELIHVKLNSKEYACNNLPDFLLANSNSMDIPNLYLNNNGTLMLNYHYSNYTVVNGDSTYTKYRKTGKVKLSPSCDSTLMILRGYGYKIINFDEYGKILNNTNISISKNKDYIDTFRFKDSWGKYVTTFTEKIDQLIPVNEKWISIGNKYYLAMTLKSNIDINGIEFYFDSLSTALFEYDSAFNFIRVKNFGKSSSNMFVNLVQDTKDNPVIIFENLQNTSIDGFTYNTNNGHGNLLTTIDKNTFKTINITSLNDNVGNVIANAFSNDGLKNIYAFGYFNGVMEINKQRIIDSNNVDYFFLKLGLCNVPPKLNKAGTLNLCIGANDTIKAQKFYDRYRWYYNETEQRNNITFKIPVTKPGRYYLVVDSGECRGISDVITYTQTLKLDVGRDTLICNQDSFLLQTKPDKKSYLWNTGSKLSFIYPKKTGKYNVQIKDKFDCPTADTINVKFVNVSKPKLNTSRIPNLCEGESVDIFTTANFEKYHWLQNNLLLPKDTSYLIKIKIAGNYAVEGDSAGCSRKSDLLTINVYPNPEIDLGNDKILCNTKTFELAAPAGYVSYLWSTSETTTKIKLKNSGKYSVSVFNQYGCKGSDEVTITLDSLVGPLLYLTDGKLYCLTTGEFKWFLNDVEIKGETANFIFPKESGQYKVIVTNTSTGCQNSGTINYIYRPKDEKLILAVYPNPASDKLSILFDLGKNIKGTINYKMYQIDGKLLGKGDFEFDSNVSNNVTLATDFLAQGMYYLEVNINEFKNVVKFNKL